MNEDIHVGGSIEPCSFLFDVFSVQSTRHTWLIVNRGTWLERNKGGRNVYSELSIAQLSSRAEEKMKTTLSDIAHVPDVNFLVIVQGSGFPAS